MTIVVSQKIPAFTHILEESQGVLGNACGLSNEYMGFRTIGDSLTV